MPVGKPVTLHARVKRPPPGAQLTYVWDFGDGTRGFGASITHTYQVSGDLQAQVKVQGSGGATPQCASVCSGVEAVDVTVTGKVRGPNQQQGLPTGSGNSSDLGGTGDGGTGTGPGSGDGTGGTANGTSSVPAAERPPKNIRPQRATRPESHERFSADPTSGEGKTIISGTLLDGVRRGRQQQPAAAQGVGQPEGREGDPRHVRKRDLGARQHAARGGRDVGRSASRATTRQTAARMIAAGGIEEVLFHISSALRVPVLLAALVALLITLYDLGAFFVELSRRRRRDAPRQLQAASRAARDAISTGDTAGAARALLPLATSAQMADALTAIVDEVGERNQDDEMAKVLADFDLTSLRRLERTRMMVRFGPALGLMGTLIPLSPALEGLAKGNVKLLSDNLRVAFSVTVLGLLIGAIAFTVSLVRDRLYAQDLSDLEYVASTLTPPQR